MTGRSTVSVLVPVLDEERDIGGCIDAIAAQDCGPDAIELVVADGCSRDRTIAMVRAAASRHRFRRVIVVANPARRTSAGLNRALEEATGEYVVRVDARSRVQPDYVRSATAVLAARPDVGVVGGAQVAVPRDGSALAVGIARALQNRWTTGLSRYRRSTASGPADTVWMGVFRRADLLALGGWSPAVALNEDFELNRRYREAGWTVWFDATLRSAYLPRPDLESLARQYFRFGRVKGTWWARGDRPSPRQAALLAAPLAAGLVGVAMGRRLGTAAALGAAAAGALVVDASGGADAGGGARDRAVALAAEALSCGGWWMGAVVGYLGERAGVEHRHG